MIITMITLIMNYDDGVQCEEGVHTCLLCDSTFRKLSNLELHMRIPETEDDKCQECGYHFSSWCQVSPLL
jgi:hypothetical protein